MELLYEISQHTVLYAILCSQYSVLQVIMYFPVSFLFYLRNYSSTVGCFWCPDWMPINGHAPTSVRPRDKSLGISGILRSSFQRRWLKETCCVCQETLSKCRRGKEWGCAQPIPILYCWYSNIESILVVWYCLPLLRSRAVSTSILQDCFGSLTLFSTRVGPSFSYPGCLVFQGALVPTLVHSFTDEEVMVSLAGEGQKGPSTHLSKARWCSAGTSLWEMKL